MGRIPTPRDVHHDRVATTRQFYSCRLQTGYRWSDPIARSLLQSRYLLGRFYSGNASEFGCLAVSFLHPDDKVAAAGVGERGDVAEELSPIFIFAADLALVLERLSLHFADQLQEV